MGEMGNAKATYASVSPSKGSISIARSGPIIIQPNGSASLQRRPLPQVSAVSAFHPVEPVWESRRKRHAEPRLSYPRCNRLRIQNSLASREQS